MKALAPCLSVADVYFQHLKERGQNIMTEECRAILDFISCEYELFPDKSNQAKIIDRFAFLMRQGRSEGFFPLIVIPSGNLMESLEFFVEDSCDEGTPENIAGCRQAAIEAAKGVDAKQLLSFRLDNVLQDYTDESYDILGRFVRSEPQNVLDLSMLEYSPCESVIIAKIPAENPWELAAWVPMGGFNDCPSPAEQVAVFRYWHEKYGAVPAVVSFDMWEMALTNPPLTKEDAQTLAKEHFAFCRDTVEQGEGTIRALASKLKDSTAWFFWWD